MSEALFYISMYIIIYLSIYLSFYLSIYLSRAADGRIISVSDHEPLSATFLIHDYRKTKHLNIEREKKIKNKVFLINNKAEKTL